MLRKFLNYSLCVCMTAMMAMSCKKDAVDYNPKSLKDIPTGTITGSDTLVWNVAGIRFNSGNPATGEAASFSVIPYEEDVKFNDEYGTTPIMSGKPNETGMFQARFVATTTADSTSTRSDLTTGIHAYTGVWGGLTRRADNSKNMTVYITKENNRRFSMDDVNGIMVDVLELKVSPDPAQSKNQLNMVFLEFSDAASYPKNAEDIFLNMEGRDKNLKPVPVKDFTLNMNLSGNVADKTWGFYGPVLTD